MVFMILCCFEARQSKQIEMSCLGVLNQGRFSLEKGNYFVFFIFIIEIVYTGLAEIDVTEITIALFYSGLTRVTPGYVLRNAIRIHFCV